MSRITKKSPASDTTTTSALTSAMEPSPATPVVQPEAQSRPSLRSVMEGQPWLANVEPVSGSAQNPCVIPSSPPHVTLVPHAVQLEPADRTLALLGMQMPQQGRIFFNPASDEEIEELAEGEDSFQDAEADQFSPTSIRPMPSLEFNSSPQTLSLAQASSSVCTPPSTKKTAQEYDNERAARHIRMMTVERPRHTQISPPVPLAHTSPSQPQSSHSGNDSLRAAKAAARNRGILSPTPIPITASPGYDAWGIRRHQTSQSAEGATKPSSTGGL